jgi:hypothetical protein
VDAVSDDEMALDEVRALLARDLSEASGTASKHIRARRLAALDKLRREHAEMRALLTRAVKYACEDKAYTPGSTRLARLVLEIKRWLGIPDGTSRCSDDCPNGCAGDIRDGKTCRERAKP